MKLNDDFSNLEAFEKEIELKGFLVLWNKFQDQGANGHSYKGLKKWQAKFEPYGLIFDFGLDADPYDFELNNDIMGNLNLIGIQVNGMDEAIKLLNCNEETLINSTSSVLINGFAFNVFTYRTENNKNWYYSITATNLKSKQYKDKIDAPPLEIKTRERIAKATAHYKQK